MQRGFSEGDGPEGENLGSSLSAHTDDTVMPSKIERLPDLSGYLKVPFRPDWFMVTAGYRDMPQRAASFVGV